MNDIKWPIAGTQVSVGDKFGRLTVENIFRERSRIRLVCKCECGNKLKTQARHVVSGRTQSCGCFRSDYVGKINKDKRRKAPGWASMVSLYNLYRHGARKRELEFDLSKESFASITKMNCVYCGVLPAQEHCAGYGSYRYNGIDRKNNSLGYTQENSVACCFRCNRAKGTDTAEAYEAWLKGASEFIASGKVQIATTGRTRYFSAR